MEKEFICCICGKKVTGYGNNPDGAMWKNDNDEVVEPSFSADAKCCSECDQRYVIPGRIYKLKQSGRI